MKHFETIFTMTIILTVTILMGLSFNEMFNRSTSLQADIAMTMLKGQ